MPIVRVEIAKGIATVEQKRAVIRRMTDVLVEELRRDPEFVFVVIDTRLIRITGVARDAPSLTFGEVPE